MVRFCIPKATKSCLCLCHHFGGRLPVPRNQAAMPYWVPQALRSPKKVRRRFLQQRGLRVRGGPAEGPDRRGKGAGFFPAVASIGVCVGSSGSHGRGQQSAGGERCVGRTSSGVLVAVGKVVHCSLKRAPVSAAPFSSPASSSSLRFSTSLTSLPPPSLPLLRHPALSQSEPPALTAPSPGRHGGRVRGRTVA